MKKFIQIVFLFLIALIQGIILQAQNNPDLKRTWNWYFGAFAGLNFSSGAAQPLFDGQTNTTSSCQTISDTSGNLLFYSDGTNVWNKNQQLMSSATLMGSGANQGVIVPQPGNEQIYYFFYSGYDSINTAKYHVYYSVVDMSQNAGLGSLTSKNKILLKDSATQKIAAIKHKNNHDIWIITMKFHTNQFSTYLLTDNGLDTIPVISYAGHIERSYLCPVKPSPDGTKLAAAFLMSNYDNDLELLNFDNALGIVSGAIPFHKCNLPFPDGCLCLGIEFSPDGKKLYYTIYSILLENNNLVINYVYQIDISSNDSAQIVNSKILLDSIIITNPTNYNDGARYGIQLASDKKIYLTKCDKSFVGVINNPDDPGLSCNFVDSSVYLGWGRYCESNFPSFMNSYLPRDPVSEIIENKDKEKNIIVQPNPFSNICAIFFRNTNISKPVSVDLYSITGIKQKEYTAYIYDSEIYLQRGALPDGMYLVEIRTRDKVFTEKLIINH
ncbi:MAG: T9SS type A sorting domain-containing protein [Bacteroidia bacterium]|nr:T9SS type A sorting domain-containing protein [Bacteroidia bacterium]